MKVTLTLKSEDSGLYEKDVYGVTKLTKDEWGDVWLYTKDEMKQYRDTELVSYEATEETSAQSS